MTLEKLKTLFLSIPALLVLIVVSAMFLLGNDWEAHPATWTSLWLLFAGTAALAHLSLCRLVSSKWTALAATVLAFSSYCCLYYNALLSAGAAVALFGLMLTFHGMVVFVQEGHFRQLMVKAVIALLLGGQVLVLLLPFLALGLVNELSKMRLGEAADSAAPAPVSTAVRNYLFLGLAVLLTGAFTTGFNVINKSDTVEGAQTSLTLPIARLIQTRAAADEEFKANPARVMPWPRFLNKQLQLVGGMVAPYTLPGYVRGLSRDSNPPAATRGTVIGLIALAVCLLGIAFGGKHKILWTSLALSGLLWMLPMRYAAIFHYSGTVFYIGIPLVFFSLAIEYLHRVSGHRLIPDVCVAATVLFLLSGLQMSREGRLDRFVMNAGAPILSGTGSYSYDVYLIDNKLYYARGARNKEVDDHFKTDRRAWFFLHVYPVDPEVLSDDRKPHGFANLDFRFNKYALRLGAQAIAEASLPNYDIRRIRTGQFIPGEGRLWTDEADLNR